MFSSILRTMSMIVLAFCVSASFAATKVCIDPGHGGSDSGAVGCGQYEDTNNLNTGLKFRTWLNTDTNDSRGGGSWTVYMTRTTDVYVSLSGRTTYANNNGVARFMSIHNNACGSCGATGTETFCYTSLGTSADLRNKIQYRMLAMWGLTNRGNKSATFYVLKYTNMPATLVELGFIDRCSPDAGYLGNATHQNNAGLAQLYAIQTHLGLAAYKPGTTTLPTYTNDSPACSSSWATGTSAADKYGSNYRYRSTAAVSDPAQWSISVGTAGTYKVSAWWSAGTNRSKTAPYITPDGSTVNVNQQANGGKFNVLKSVYLGTGTKTTKLSCWTSTGYVVIADAVRYAP